MSSCPMLVLINFDPRLSFVRLLNWPPDEGGIMHVILNLIIPVSCII